LVEHWTLIKVAILASHFPECAALQGGLSLAAAGTGCRRSVILHKSLATSKLQRKRECKNRSIAVLRHIRFTRWEITFVFIGLPGFSGE
jgi:hypothetical protein